MDGKQKSVLCEGEERRGEERRAEQSRAEERHKEWSRGKNMTSNIRSHEERSGNA